MRTRWITIGTVQTGWYIRHGNQGTPGGLYLHWRGRTSWCQPFEFYDWNGLFAAVRQRLDLARLHCVKLQCVAGRRDPLDEITLRVLVERRPEAWRRRAAVEPSRPPPAVTDNG